MTAAAYERVLAVMEGLKLFSLGSGAGLKTVSNYLYLYLCLYEYFVLKLTQDCDDPVCM